MGCWVAPDTETVAVFVSQLPPTQGLKAFAARDPGGELANRMYIEGPSYAGDTDSTSVG